MAHVNFVVLTSARTGSTWLMDRLNRQPGVEAHGELFLNHARMKPALASLADGKRFIEVRGGPKFTRPRRVFSYLDALCRPARIVGFKLMYKQLQNYPEILVYLAVHRVRVIHLTRRNLLDVVVSEELAKLTGVSHALADSSSSIPMVQIDTGTIVNRLAGLRNKPNRVRQLIRLFINPMLEVTYESLLENDDEFERILKYLEVANSRADAGSSLAKRGVRSHRESIANYDELQRRLDSTPFSHMLR
jgi:LPS sulfotransferase NodH